MPNNDRPSNRHGDDALEVYTDYSCDSILCLSKRQTAQMLRLDGSSDGAPWEQQLDSSDRIVLMPSMKVAIVGNYNSGILRAHDWTDGRVLWQSDKQQWRGMLYAERANETEFVLMQNSGRLSRISAQSGELVERIPSARPWGFSCDSSTNNVLVHTRSGRLELYERMSRRAACSVPYEPMCSLSDFSSQYIIAADLRSPLSCYSRDGCLQWTWQRDRSHVWALVARESEGLLFSLVGTPDGLPPGNLIIIFDIKTGICLHERSIWQYWIARNRAGGGSRLVSSIGYMSVPSGVFTKCEYGIRR